MSQARWVALLICALFIVGALGQQAVLPLIEGSDESLHYAYTEHLRGTWTLPDRTTYRINATGQESSQPPLTYVLAALTADLFGLPRLDDPGDLYQRLGKTRNPWNTPVTYWNRDDNRNFYYDIAPADPAISGALARLRLLSIGFGLVALAAAYGAAWELFRSTRWALFTMALFGLMPTFVHSAAYLNNDITVTAFSTLTLWLCLRMLRRASILHPGASLIDAFVIGVCAACAALAKVSGTAVIAAAGLTLVVLWARGRLSFAAFIGHGVVMALPVIALFGAWVLYGWLTYGDPFGFNTHTAHHNEYTFFSNPLPAPADIAAQFPNLFRTYFARFGLSIHLHPLIYLLFAAAPLAALMGWLGVFRRRARASGGVDAALILGAAALIALFGLFRWMQILPAIPARLLYPAHLSITAALVGGLFLLTRRLPRLGRVLAGFTLGVTAFSGVIGGAVAVHAAFTLPPAGSTALPVDSTPVYTFDSVALTGWTLPENPRLDGTWYSVGLCWQAGAVPSREPAYTVKLIDLQGNIAADRTTLFGLGLRAGLGWRAGERFCETVELALNADALRPATAYNVVLSLLDAQTLAANHPATAADGAVIGAPILGRAYAPAPTAASETALEPISARVPFAALVGYRLEGQIAPGANVRLTLVWRADGGTPIDYHQFIHLMGEGETFALAAAPPREDGYPTSVWRAGDVVEDSWTIPVPAELPAEEYQIGIGFFDPRDGTRAAAVQNGQPAPDRIIRLS
ncbi:MAG: phospholipid carrier-dependent glycosyltransferase [bacterium]|nr:phospholipid carrier-dependent glycosyltransferase [bacterium]